MWSEERKDDDLGSDFLQNFLDFQQIFWPIYKQQISLQIKSVLSFSIFASNTKVVWTNKHISWNLLFPFLCLDAGVFVMLRNFMLFLRQVLISCKISFYKNCSHQVFPNLQVWRLLVACAGSIGGENHHLSADRISRTENRKKLAYQEVGV